MNCYDLTLKYITILGDIDRAIEKKSKSKKPTEIDRLDAEIDRLEIKLFEIKNQLKLRRVY